MSEISNPDIVSFKNDEQTGGGSSKPVEDIEVKDAISGLEISDMFVFKY